MNIEPTINKQPNKLFSIDVILSKSWELGHFFKEHKHKYIQILFFIQGQALIKCNSNTFRVNPQDVIVINSQEMHYVESLSNSLKFYLIRIDLPFLFSEQVDICQAKYLAPLSENLILFNNFIQNDQDVLNCISNIIKEYLKEDIGYELAVKGYVYSLIVLMLRKHTANFISSKEFSLKVDNLKRFYDVFQYIDLNFNKKITASILAEIVNISTYYFSRIFKQITGKTVTKYVNEIRLAKAIEFLQNDDMNLTETATRCGFNDINYFSRLFKAKYGVAPTKFRL